MLVCPHCQFENPDVHKFCQHCGASLTEHDCPACGATLPFNAQHCPQCGTASGKIWRAVLLPVVTQQSPLPVGATAGESDAIGTKPLGLEDLLSFPVIGKYLDADQRYQLLEPLTPLATSGAFETRVLDVQPFQIALLQAACSSVEENTDPIDDRSIPLIPPIAQPYLSLQEHYPLLPLPQIHDAWEQDGWTVLLLEDRSYFPTLLTLWQKDDVLPLQILHWLHEMLDFWAALQSQHCCQSLFELDNLRVDEDYLLCLQQLYSDPPDRSPQLGDLGQLWQFLSQQSQRTQNGELVRLCRDLETGVIASLDEVRLQLEAIAGTQQVLQPSTIMTSSQPDPSRLTSMDPVPERDGVDITPPESPSDPVNNPFDLAMSGLSALTEREPPTDAEDVTRAEDSSNESDDLPTIVLPMRLISLEDAGLTDIGRQRDHNEDCFSIQTELQKQEGPQGRTIHAKGLYVLCDGMGGHAGGEDASALAVETLLQYFADHWTDQLPDEASIREAIQHANRAIYTRNQNNARSGSGRMGTTLVMVLIQDTEAAIAHVGDSRLYRFSRRQGLEQVTVDHEVGQREIQRGVEPAIAYARPDAYQLTQALGPRDEHFINPDVKFLELNEDTLLLLCSDGLSDNDLLETYWHTHIEPLLSSQTNLERGVSQLIELANQVNGHDNITAIAIRAKVRPNLELLNRYKA